MARVMVSVPSGEGRVRSIAAEALGNLDPAGNDVVHRYVNYYGVDFARNEMARIALEEGFDHLLMVDSDTVVPRDALANLMSDGVDVCMGYYPRGTGDGSETNVVKYGAMNHDECFSVDEMAKLRESGAFLVKVKCGGLGCALFRTDVFRMMDRPWFKFVEHRKGAPLGEDYYFFHQCRNMGVEAFVDTRVACKHVKERVLEAR